MIVSYFGTQNTKKMCLFTVRMRVILWTSSSLLYYSMGFPVLPHKYQRRRNHGLSTMLLLFHFTTGNDNSINLKSELPPSYQYQFSLSLSLSHTNILLLKSTLVNRLSPGKPQSLNRLTRCKSQKGELPLLYTYELI